MWVIRKDYRFWGLTKGDPHLIEIPVDEDYDVDALLEFEVAEAAYRKSLQERISTKLG